ncbi:MAG: hypothetical protein IPO68_11585 [Chitinophagaceae bacterium]|nr:hypothetical protein [Chitinophagaceae bacterium]
MKILFVQKMNGISGSELYLMQLLPELKKRGYDVEVLIVLQAFTEKTNLLLIISRCMELLPMKYMVTVNCHRD